MSKVKIVGQDIRDEVLLSRLDKQVEEVNKTLRQLRILRGLLISFNLIQQRDLESGITYLAIEQINVVGSKGRIT